MFVCFNHSDSVSICHSALHHDKLCIFSKCIHDCEHSIYMLYNACIHAVLLSTSLTMVHSANAEGWPLQLPMLCLALSAFVVLTVGGYTCDEKQQPTCNSHCSCPLTDNVCTAYQPPNCTADVICVCFHRRLQWVGALGPISVAALSITLVHLGELQQRAGMAVVGSITPGLPHLTVSWWLPIDQFWQLGSTAVVISFVSLLESISIARALAEPQQHGGHPLDPNQELLGG